MEGLGLGLVGRTKDERSVGDSDRSATEYSPDMGDSCGWNAVM